ncbi:hypothetical protein Avbf_02245 [Armadillidium vulgare]|nr:hypothetical protein Avbf_02245 [Armadillidium vulgare]
MPCIGEVFNAVCSSKKLTEFIVIDINEADRRNPEIDVQKLKSIVKIKLIEGKPSHPKMYNRQVKNVRRFFSSEGNWNAVE